MIRLTVYDADGVIKTSGTGGGAVSSVFGRTGAITAQVSDYDANQVDFTPAGNIAATDVQAAIEELDSEKAASSHTHAASAIVSGTLVHERGGLEADVSTYDGLIKIVGGATSQIKCNFAAAAAPTVNDDSGDGYSVGSRWLDTTNDKEYVCLDATLGAAVWTETTGGAGSSYYQTVQDNGSDETQRAKLNFVSGTGVSVSVADDAGNNRSTVTPAMDINGLTAITSLELAADYLPVYDNSAAGVRKFLAQYLPGYKPLVPLTELASAASSISLSSIPSSYDALLLVLFARTSLSADSDPGLMRFNGDTANANYYTDATDFWGAGSLSGIERRGTVSGIELHDFAGNTAPANTFAQFYIHIFGYAETGQKRMANWHGWTMIDTSTGFLISFLGGGLWTNTANAISSITLVSKGGANFMAGTRYGLYAL